MMEKLVGRSAERSILKQALVSSSAELIAVYGRRRVGKTFMIRSVYEKELVFEFTGLHNARMEEQLKAFSYALKTAMNSPADLAVPGSWIAAFHILEKFLEPQVAKRRVVIFFDEFPWINTARSNFLKAFEHFWNNWASRQSNLTAVICGSAASWMIQHIVNNRGGLHNRVNIKMRLLPFTLRETEDYLKSRSVNLDRYQLLQLYMTMGGIPQYLKNIQRGESAAQAIDRMFFTKDGAMQGEFANLYHSLFDEASRHVSVIRALAANKKGLTRNEIIKESKLSTGGTATSILNELEASGFITAYLPFDRTSKDSVYRLTDEYSLFYLKFVEKSRATGAGTWLRLNEGASWKSWSGYAFEAICLKHTASIKNALGIGDIYTEESVWRHVPVKGETGAQIDLLLDRKDHCISICEMKFSAEPFTITRKYAEELTQKKQVFLQKSKTKKTIFLVFVTTYGVVKNAYSGMVQNDVVMDALFE